MLIVVRRIYFWKHNLQNMRVKDILKKYIIPGALAGMSADSWYNSRFGSKSETVLSVERDEARTKFNKAQEEISNALNKLQDYRNHDLILRSKAYSISEGNHSIKTKLNEVNELKSKLMESGLSDTPKSELQLQLISKYNECFRMVKEHTDSMIDFTNEVKKETTPNNLNNTLDSSELVSTDIKESNILGYLSEIKDNINSELANLSSEQLGCLTNLLGFIMILGGIYTITLILFGEYIINYFKLDERYPKLSKYILYRQTFNKYYLIFNFIIIYLILILYIMLNFYMLIM